MMHLVTNSQIFAEQLRLLNRIAPAKHALPILGHVLLTATPDGLTLFATDLEIGMQTPCLAATKDPGQATVSVSKLLALVEQFPNDEVHLKTDDKFLHIACRKFKSKLPTLRPEDFPVLPTIAGKIFTTSGDVLRSLIGKTRYAIAEGNSKYFLQGALLDLTTTEVQAMVATDGKRLACYTAERKDGAETGKVILPIKILDLVNAQSEVQTYTMTIGDKHIGFESNNGRLLFSRLLEGEFPNYHRFIPQDHDRVAKIDRFALAAALRRVGLAAGETKSTIFSFQPGTLDLSASSTDGESQEQIPAEFEGEPITLCADWSAVVEMLGVAESPTIEVRLKDALKPMLFVDGANHVAVVLTMRA